MSRLLSAAEKAFISVASSVIASIPVRVYRRGIPVVDAEPPLAPLLRPLFLPLETWTPFDQPTMSVSDFELRKACRALDMAFENRTREVRSYR